MQKESMLTQLGYAPNEALVNQLEKIKYNTNGYEKIEKHIMDLHDHLKVDDGYIAMSNSTDSFKIKIESKSPELTQEAHEKIQHFCKKFKVNIKKLENKDTYYILGFKN